MEKITAILSIGVVVVIILILAVMRHKWDDHEDTTNEDE